MLVTKDHVDLDTPTGPMRTFVFTPVGDGTYPGVVMFSEIFQMTSPIERIAINIAAEGYIVTVCDIYHEFEAPGMALSYAPEGVDRGNFLKTEKTLAAYDDDARACIQYLKGLDRCSGKLGCCGVCIGGHLSLRCAMNPEISAAVCFYATDIHKRSLGKGMNDDSLDRFGDLSGEMLMVWGKEDPHVPQAGRDLIYKQLLADGVDFTWHEFHAQHAFMRDGAPRHDPALAKICYQLMFEMFQRKLIY
jgi:carboxymethylenebutenolidase